MMAGPWMWLGGLLAAGWRTRVTASRRIGLASSTHQPAAFSSGSISSTRVSASFIQRPLAGLFPAGRLARLRRLFAGWLV
jgi:hypothetical protein